MLTNSRTTVISVRGRDRSILMGDPNFAYVGRRCAGWPASIWGNPFRPGMSWEDATAILKSLPGVRIFGKFQGDCSILEAYHSWVVSQPHLVRKLPELRGRLLGCWCGAWEPGRPEIGCHAVVLAKLADATGEGGTPHDG